MKIEFLFAWYDIWVGVFYDQDKKWVYIFLIPMFGIVLKPKPCKGKMVFESTYHDGASIFRCTQCNYKDIGYNSSGFEPHFKKT